MKFELFTRVALKSDLPEHGLKGGDVATIVENHLGHAGQEPGYTLEVFTATGQTLTTVTVRESQIEMLSANEILHLRPISSKAA
jgi:hypothetical protein